MLDNIYASPEATLPFNDYIAKTRHLIKERRADLRLVQPALADRILTANTPYELPPLQTLMLSSNKGSKIGALLIHGLLDCPFSLRDIGQHLAEAGILCRSILLPGHGTQPQDLINVTYQDWIAAVRYGVASLKKEVDQIYLIGYSTGAALSIHQAMLDTQIAGLVLFAPAIHLKAPVEWVRRIHAFKKWLGLSHHPWLFHVKENDYVKYQSVAYNGVIQVNQLMQVIREKSRLHRLHCPLFMVVSEEDETISSTHAIDFFSSYLHTNSQLLLYSANSYQSSDARIRVRSSEYKELNIKNFSHICLPYAPHNMHYGIEGDYKEAAKPKKRITYGAYNRLVALAYDSLYRHKLTNQKRKILTYNPDFDFMAKSIQNFIFDNCQ
jgi:esterase/lipase